MINNHRLIDYWVLYEAPCESEYSVIDDGVPKRLTLKKEANIVRASIINACGATEFCARFLDEDGIPVKGITISLDNSSK